MINNPNFLQNNQLKFQLLNTMYNNPQLEYLANKIESTIGYPVYFTNLNWDVYAQSNGVNPDDVINLNDLYETLRKKSENYKDYLNGKADLNPILEESPAIIKVKKKNKKYLFAYSYLYGIKTGIVVFPEYNQPLTGMKKEILDTVLSVFALNQAIHESYWHNQSIHDNGWSNIFIDLIENRIKDENSLLEAIQNERLITYIKSYIILTITKKSGVYNKNQYYNLLNKEIRTNPGYHTSFFYKDYHVFVINDSSNMENTKSLILNDEFINIIKKLNLYVGYSNLQNNLLDFKYAYETSILASKYARRWDTDLHISSYEECKVYDLISNIDTSKYTLEKYLSRIVIDIINYDKKNSTNYYKTLTLLIDNQLNLTKTAKNLFIHKSTLSYRMKKMSELFDIDWENSRVLFHISLTIYILKYFLI